MSDSDPVTKSAATASAKGIGAMRQILDVFSSSNFPWTNPEVLRTTAEQCGWNFVKGCWNFIEDLRRLSNGLPIDDTNGFIVGKNVAVTPGKIVLPNDLSPNNSLIRYLVSQCFAIFCISSRNPGPELRDASFAAQTDFTKAGELQLFADESELALLDDVMWRQGFLDSTQMAGAFQMLRLNDLVWSRIIKSYLLGEQDQPNDLKAWNADATWMPFRMHSDYLHRMFLYDDLAKGQHRVNGGPVGVSAIRLPIFAVGAETDHVAPWQSVYMIHLLNQGDITFVLTSGGHNAGTVSEPGHPHRHYHFARRESQGRYVAREHEGSWWPAWVQWLGNHSGAPISPPPLGFPERGYPVITAAPGSYVFER